MSDNTSAEMNHLITEMIPVCYVIERDLMVDKSSESYKQRRDKYYNEVTYHLYDLSNPERNDMSHDSVILDQLRTQNIYTEHEWRQFISTIVESLKDSEFRQQHNLSEKLEIIAYRENVTTVVEVLFGNMTAKKFDEEFDKQITKLRSIQEKKRNDNSNINIGLDLNDPNQFRIIFKQKCISFYCEHRSMNIYDLRPLSPELWARTSKPSPNESVKR